MGISPLQIVDAGASNGQWTLECLKMFPKSRYFLVDPLTENVQSLSKLQSENSNVKFWSGGLGKKEGQFTLNVHGDQSSFLASEYTMGSQGQKRIVEIRTLDSFIGSELMESPNMIKADVQGYELEVLKGCTKCLETTEILLLEVSYRHIYSGGPLAHEVISYVGELGFRIFDICSYVQRPRDLELVQSDIIFAKEGSRLFDYEGYA
jgi:FkbM family methyltransferase